MKIKTSDFNKLKSGDIIDDDIKSYTTDKTTLKPFISMPEKDETTVILINNSHNGASVRFAQKYNENEVLVKDKMAIKKIRKQNGYYLIDVE